jgi:peptidoglycan/xylan/chitin deacetylase (PgdA/CDA1 family)
MVKAVASAGIAAGLAAGVFAYAAMWPASKIFGHTIVAGNDPLEIALTFDDGPNDPDTFRLLDVLARHNVRATFFVIGRFARQRPDIVRAVAAADHLIGNHTMTHPLLVTRTPGTVRQELRDANAAIQDALGARVEFFRPPHGGRRPDVLRAAHQLGLKTVLWNAMGRDWNPTGNPQFNRQIAARVQKALIRNMKTGVGTNVLLHDGGQAAIGQNRSATVEAAEMIIREAKETGNTFVTVDAWRNL